MNFKRPSPHLWHGETVELLRLGVPIALAHLANMGLQLINMAFVGRVSAAALGSLSIGNAIFAPLMVACIGILLGLDYLIARAFGSGEETEADQLLIQSLYIATISSLLVIGLMHLAPALFGKMGLDPAVASQAGPYLRALSWGIWPWMLFTCFRQYLQAQGIAMPVFVALLAGNAVTALGNWILVFGKWGAPALGSVGAGWATTIARVLMLALLAAYTVARDRKGRRGLSTTSRAASPEKMKQIVLLGAPASLQVMLEVGAFAAATLLAGRLGQVDLAAHQIVLQVASVSFMIPLALGSAGAVHVAQAVGAGQTKTATRTGWISFALGGSLMLLCGAFIYLFAKPVLGLFTTDQGVIEVGITLMAIAALFQFFDGIQAVAAGVLRGVGNTRAALIANLAGHWGVGLPIGVLLCFVFNWGIQGLWVGLSVGLIFVAIALTAVWRALSARDLKHGF